MSTRRAVLADVLGPGADEFTQCSRALSILLPPEKFTAVLTALGQVMARVIETCLLGDSALAPIARLPDVYLAQAEELIKERIDELGLGELLTHADVQYLRSLLVSGVPKTGHEAVGEGLLVRLFQHIRSTQRELRCGICGYHFRSEDLSGRRLALAQQFEFEYARTISTRRVSDSLKPYLETRLEVDHVVPRLGWGPSRLENLQILCQFCNRGKLAYRRPLESLSALIAASLPPLDGLPPLWAVRHILVSAWRSRDGRCEACFRDNGEVELSVSRCEGWFTPWTLRVVCYGCSDS
jgi:5-methylcytosine-specific restriction endonuclease McrA